MEHINHESLKPSQLTTLWKPRKLTPLSPGSVLQTSPKNKMASQAPSSSICFSKEDIADGFNENAKKQF